LTTIHDRVAEARRRLTAAGISTDEAELDARLLAEHVLGWTTERFFADAGTRATPDFSERYDMLIARRAAREPYAYIVGRQEFWGLEFFVGPAVLIPRPETELIVEAALERIADATSAAIADVGTGSGCIAVTLARERRAATLTATDISSGAIDIARANAARFDVADRVDLRRVDMLDGIEGPFDLIVSNPPYVCERDRGRLQPEVQFEPAAALFAGEDGLDAIRRLVNEAASRLKTGGALIFEFGFGQADAVAELISDTSGLTIVGLRRDLQDIPRTAIAQRA
jgi:release factor glutamine methyltransferase